MELCIRPEEVRSSSGRGKRETSQTPGGVDSEVMSKDDQPEGLGGRLCNSLFAYWRSVRTLWLFLRRGNLSLSDRPPEHRRLCRHNGPVPRWSSTDSPWSRSSLRTRYRRPSLWRNRLTWKTEALVHPRRSPGYRPIYCP